VTDAGRSSPGGDTRPASPLPRAALSAVRPLAVPDPRLPLRLSPPAFRLPPPEERAMLIPCLPSAFIRAAIRVPPRQGRSPARAAGVLYFPAPLHTPSSLASACLQSNPLYLVWQAIKRPRQAVASSREYRAQLVPSHCPGPRRRPRGRARVRRPLGLFDSRRVLRSSCSASGAGSTLRLFAYAGVE
jgi:hypothetical protein